MFTASHADPLLDLLDKSKDEVEVLSLEMRQGWGGLRARCWDWAGLHMADQGSGQGAGYHLKLCWTIQGGATTWSCAACTVRMAQALACSVVRP